MVRGKKKPNAGDEDSFARKYVPWLKSIIIPAAAALAVYQSGVLNTPPQTSHPSSPHPSALNRRLEGRVSHLPEPRRSVYGVPSISSTFLEPPPKHDLSLEDARSDPSKRQRFLEELAGEVEAEGVDGQKVPIHVVYDHTGELVVRRTVELLKMDDPGYVAKQGGQQKLFDTRVNEEQFSQGARSFASTSRHQTSLGRGRTEFVFVYPSVFSGVYYTTPNGSFLSREISPDDQISSRLDYCMKGREDIKSVFRHELRHVIDERDGVKCSTGVLTWRDQLPRKDSPVFSDFIELRAYCDELDSYFMKMNKTLRALDTHLAVELRGRVFQYQVFIVHPLLRQCVTEYRGTADRVLKQCVDQMVEDLKTGGNRNR